MGHITTGFLLRFIIVKDISPPLRANAFCLLLLMMGTMLSAFYTTVTEDIVVELCQTSEEDCEPEEERDEIEEFIFINETTLATASPNSLFHRDNNKLLFPTCMEVYTPPPELSM